MQGFFATAEGCSADTTFVVSRSRQAKWWGACELWVPISCWPFAEQ